MNNKFTKTLLALSLISCTTFANATYTLYLPAENDRGGPLEKGTIKFVTKTESNPTPPVVDVPEIPEETPEEPTEPEVPGKDFLYKVALGSHSTTASSFLYPNQALTGSPLSCGDRNTGNCFVVGAGAGMVVMTYQGTDASYATNFPIGDLIVVKSGLFNTTTECNLNGNNSYYTDTIVRNVQISYKCPAGSLPLPTKAESPATVNAQFSVSFYKNK